MALRYKNTFLIDCIYMDINIMNDIQKTLINNVNFVDPGLQMLNNIRMSMEIFRLDKIDKDKDNTILKYSTLLSYYFNHNNISLI